MRSTTFAILGTAIMCTVATVGINLAQQKAPAPAVRTGVRVTRPTPATASAAQAAAPRAAAAAPALPLEAQSALLKDYCQGCHNDKSKTGGMTLTSLDLTHFDQTPELAEKMIKKLR